MLQYSFHHPLALSIRSAKRSIFKSQEQHNLKVSFQEDLLSLLEKHGVEYDQRYIWS